MHIDNAVSDRRSHMTAVSLGTSFQSQEGALFRQAPRVTGECAVRADDAVTGHDDADRIAAGGSAGRSCTTRASRTLGKFRIGNGLAECDPRDCLPHRTLKRRPTRGDLDGKAHASAVKIFRKLAFRLT